MLRQVVQEADPPLTTFYRHISKGAWPFSTRDHGWPISDCTSEGFKAALGLAALGRPGLVGKAISRQRLEEAVRVILSYQNSDGGMATYENTRSFHWLEVGAAAACLLASCGRTVAPDVLRREDSGRVACAPR